jgi:flavin reductase (DIM6/NTAB) family NADH-FMN oxidoreductase RutF
VVAIPTVDMIDTVIGIGTCSGADTDKFDKFDLAPKKAKHVGAPLLGKCLANIECRVEEIIEPHGIVVLESLAAYRDDTRKEQRTLHAVGDGTFVVDGRRIDRKAMMAAKLPGGL